MTFTEIEGDVFHKTATGKDNELTGFLIGPGLADAENCKYHITYSY